MRHILPALLVLLAGLAQASAQPASPAGDVQNTGTVIIYRSDNEANPSIYVNNVEIARLDGKRFLEFRLLPGSYDIDCSKPRQQRITLDVKAGDTYHLRVWTGYPDYKMRPATAEQVRIEMPDATPLGPEWIFSRGYERGKILRLGSRPMPPRGLADPVAAAPPRAQGRASANEQWAAVSPSLRTFVVESKNGLWTRHLGTWAAEVWGDAGLRAADKPDLLISVDDVAISPGANGPVLKYKVVVRYKTLYKEATFLRVVPTRTLVDEHPPALFFDEFASSIQGMAAWVLKNQRIPDDVLDNRATVARAAAEAAAVARASSEPAARAVPGATPPPQDPGAQLRAAAGRGDVKAVETLLSQGVAPDAAFVSGRTTTICTTPVGERFEINQRIGERFPVPPGLNCFDSFATSTPLLEAIDQGHREVVQLLLKSGAAVNTVATDRLSPLMVAAARGHAAIVEALLASGADPNHRVEDGIVLHFKQGTDLIRRNLVNALDGALFASRSEIVRALTSKGAVPDERQRSDVARMLKN